MLLILKLLNREHKTVQYSRAYWWVAQSPQWCNRHRQNMSNSAFSYIKRKALNTFSS